MRIEAVIFDMDGVLVNSEPIYEEIEKKAFKLLGLNISESEHQTFRGTANDHMWKAVRKNHGLKIPLNQLIKMSDDMTLPVFEAKKNIDPMPGVTKLIKFLHEKRIPLAVASSSASNIIDIILTRTKLKEYFTEIISSQLVCSSKPAPDIFLHTARKLNTEPEKCMVIEDSTNGIKAAKSAGMHCIAYAGPGSEFQDQSKADLIVEKFEEVAELFKSSK